MRLLRPGLTGVGLGRAVWVGRVGSVELGLARPRSLVRTFQDSRAAISPMRTHTDVMSDRVRVATVIVLLAIFAVAALVGVTSAINTSNRADSEQTEAVEDATTDGTSTRTLSPVELGILNDLGYTVTP